MTASVDLAMPFVAVAFAVIEYDALAICKGGARKGFWPKTIPLPPP